MNNREKSSTAHVRRLFLLRNETGHTRLGGTVLTIGKNSQMDILTPHPKNTETVSQEKVSSADTTDHTHSLWPTKLVLQIQQSLPHFMLP